MERIILHIDMNSFFASVEQQANPLLRGKAIGVGGKPGTRSIIAAASKEAKALGVKGIMNSYKALQILPSLIIVDGDTDAYAETNRRFVEIFKRYTNEVEVFSIDECWLDVTGLAKTYDEAKIIAQKIKVDMAREIGPYVTCSIGIAPNKLLAKLASDLEKPNGLFVIRPSAVSRVMRSVKLSDLLGIGPRVEKHLSALNIKTTLQLSEADDSLLAKEFGIIGRILKRAAQGLDDTPVVSLESPAKSVGHSFTLPTDTKDPQVLRKTLFALCEKVARRLRRHNYLARRFSIWCRFKDFQGGFSEQSTLDAHTSDGNILLKAAWPLLKDRYKNHEIRALGITTFDLIQAPQKISPLWKPDAKRIQATQACDKINDRFGERSIQATTLIKTKLTRHVSGFKPLR